MHANAISRGSKLTVEYYAHPYFIGIVKTEYWFRWLCRVWNRGGITPGSAPGRGDVIRICLLPGGHLDLSMGGGYCNSQTFSVRG